MTKIKQIFPVPQGQRYYAVFTTDEDSSSGYYAERVDFIAIVKYYDPCDHDIVEVTGLLGDMDIASSEANYYGIYSGEALKTVFPELWEEMSNEQNELSPWEQIIAAQRDRLYSQSEQISLLKEKIARLERDMETRENSENFERN